MGLVQRMWGWANTQRDRTALIVLGDGDNETERATYAELHLAAGAYATALTEAGASGQPVIVALPTGVDFAAAFLGCLYAGAVAVPVPPPTGGRGAERLRGVADHAGARWSIGDVELGLRRTTAASAPSPAAEPPAPDAPAFLQYTSGSTATPRGVVVSHANLAVNLEMMADSIGFPPHPTYVSWLPLFHDMGLIGNLLTVLYFGGTLAMMPPLEFVRKPERWLKAISRYRADVSGSPNFGYDLCVRRSADMDLTGVDLSAWNAGFCGAERVRASTMRAFAELFAPAGFRATTLWPCYGLAEATLFVSGGPTSTGAKTLPAERAPTGVSDLISCGPPAQGSRMLIVDPDTRQPRPAGEVGEVWVQGPHVAGGYWRDAEASRATFAAHAADGSGPWLRTGDLGLLHEGELYVTGRMKDVIVSRGVNVAAEDVEAAVVASSPAFGGVAAAFVVEADDAETLIVVQELSREGGADLDVAAAQAAAADAVAAACGLRLGELLLVPQNSLPRTTSGKIQRARARALHAAGGLEPVRV